MRLPLLSNRGEQGFNAAAARRAADKCLPQLVRGFTLILSTLTRWERTAPLPLQPQKQAWLSAGDYHPRQLTRPSLCSRGEPPTEDPVRWADHVVAVSFTLRRMLRTCGTKTPVSVILNGFHVQAVPRTGAEKIPCSLCRR